MNSALVLAHTHKLLVYSLDAESPLCSSFVFYIGKSSLGERQPPHACGSAAFYIAALKADEMNVLFAVCLPIYCVSASRVSVLGRKDLPERSCITFQGSSYMGMTVPSES